MEALMAAHPHLLPLNTRGTGFMGVARGGKVFKIKCSNTGKVETVTVNGRLVEFRDQSAEDVVGKLMAAEDDEDTSSGIDDRAVAVMEQISLSLGWHRVEACDDDFSVLTLTSSSGGDRSLEVRVPKDFPLSPPLCSSADLPEPLSFAPGIVVSLSDALVAFEKQIALYAPIWERLRQLDEGACVIEPERPTGKDLHRRIVVGRDVTVQVTLDPEAAYDCPRLNFLGADAKVEKLRKAYESNVAAYDPEKNLVSSLEKLLGTEEDGLPGPEAKSDIGDFLVDCCICYAHLMEDEMPSESCEANCGQRFHERCLYSYLVQAPDKQERHSSNWNYAEE
jgi:hypothetical protein